MASEKQADCVSVAVVAVDVCITPKHYERSIYSQDKDRARD